jgi:hypothetical protein
MDLPFSDEEREALLKKPAKTSITSRPFTRTNKAHAIDRRRGLSMGMIANDDRRQYALKNRKHRILGGQL